MTASDQAITPKPRAIVRTVTAFAQAPEAGVLPEAEQRAQRLRELGHAVQTVRACFGQSTFAEAAAAVASAEGTTFASVGALTTTEAFEQLDDFLALANTSFHVDLSRGVETRDVDLLFEIIERAPERTFGFSWTMHNPPSTPFFNAARFERRGFAVGLQTPDLSGSCNRLDQWLGLQAKAFRDVVALFETDSEFLGLDSSVAPMGHDGSILGFLLRIGDRLGSRTLAELATSDVFTRITERLQTDNPMPVGLCGLMLPCLEDAELAAHYERGEFSIERNLFLSMHSGLGIDTYPIAADQDPARVFSILQLTRSLALKHRKPLSCRFVADGGSLGQRTDFKSPYLSDVTLRPL